MVPDIFEGLSGALALHVRNISAADTFADRRTNRLTGAELQTTAGDNVLRKNLEGILGSGGRERGERGTAGKQLGQDGVSRASVNHLAGRLHSE